MLPLILAGALAAGNTAMQMGAAKKANETNLQIAREARDYDYKMWGEQKEYNQAMWEQQNAYNSPFQQMQRLKSAQLNPNLVYGTGSIVGNSSNMPQANAPKSPVPQVHSILQGVQLPNMLGMLGQYQDLQARKAQIDQIRANTELIEQKKINEAMQPLLLGLQGKSKQLQLQKDQELYQTQIESVKAGLASQLLSNRQKVYQLNVENPVKLKQMQTDIGLKELQSALQSIELGFQQNLKPYGLTSSDNVFLRWGANMIDKFKGYDYQTDPNYKRLNQK